MVDHWKRNGPPVYMTVASYFGLGEKPKETGNLEDLEKMFAGSGGVI